MCLQVPPLCLGTCSHISTCPSRQSAPDGKPLKSFIILIVLVNSHWSLISTMSTFITALFGIFFEDEQTSKSHKTQVPYMLPICCYIVIILCSLATRECHYRRLLKHWSCRIRATTSCLSALTCFLTRFVFSFSQFKHNPTYSDFPQHLLISPIHFPAMSGWHEYLS